MERTHRTAWIAGACLLLGSLAGPFPPSAFAQVETERHWVETAVETLCPIDGITGIEAQSLLPGTWLVDETRRPATGAAASITIRLQLPHADELEIERRQHQGRLRQFRVSFFSRDGGVPAPRLMAVADGTCAVRSGRRIRVEGDAWRYLDQLDGDLATVRWTETLQAPWPLGTDPGGPRIALVDSGLAYDLEIFRERLARDAAGEPLGYDHWDLDPWPYDGDVARSPFLPIRHGTAVASVLAREAPSAALIPYRYPRPDMSRLATIVADAARAGARILAMPLGSNRVEDWTAFRSALARHDILAIVSAGNNGRDLDVDPLWPAVLPLDNMIVVTSSDGFGRLADGSNWGPTSVDIMLPAENVPIVDFRGAGGTASGSSYAVPRLAALAARLLEKDPSLSTEALREAIFARARPSPFERTPVVAVGWIPDPLED
jgi:subtilisin family serine protease